MELMVKCGTRYRKADKDEILSVAARYMVSDVMAESADTPAKMREFVRRYIGPRDAEVFCAFWINSRHRLLGFDELFQGTVDSAVVIPREVVKKALARNATGVVFAHQHPSGEAEASVADEMITKRLTDALAIVDIRVLDHLIVGGGKVFSFAERGLL